jgi:regulatory protein
MREHSVAELRRKLAPHAENEAQVDGLIEELRRLGYLSDARFAQALANRRGERYGRRRVAWELDEHQVPQAERTAVLAGLAETERDRALAVWRKRFGTLPTSLAERARQHRFLAGRGFDGETITWVLRHAARADSSDD